MPATNSRDAHHPIEPFFLERWSPRAFDRSPLDETALRSLFEAARWAPSAFNGQPWVFLYARRDTAEWQRFLDLLIPFNQDWVKNASVLIYLLSDSLMQRGTDEPRASHSHSFDAGAAWAYLALQATHLGLQAHAMVGVDFDRARAELAVPDRYRLEAAIAVGRPADKSILSEALQAREVPSDRKPIAEFAFEGGFPKEKAAG
jgi:nitroreductase